MAASVSLLVGPSCDGPGSQEPTFSSHRTPRMPGCVDATPPPPRSSRAAAACHRQVAGTGQADAYARTGPMCLSGARHCLKNDVPPGEQMHGGGASCWPITRALSFRGRITPPYTHTHYTHAQLYHMPAVFTSPTTRSAYRCVEILGRGVFGTVYLVEAGKTQFAMKVIQLR